MLVHAAAMLQGLHRHPPAGQRHEHLPAAGEQLLSKLINAAINQPFLYSLMVAAGRRELFSTAKKKGVDVEGHMRRMRESDVMSLLADVEDQAVAYPAWYTQPFHAYKTGHLSFKAAFEFEPIQQVIAVRAYKTEDQQILGPAAQERMQRAFLLAVQDYLQQNSMAQPATVLDAACGPGNSAREAAEMWPAAAVTGVDLSPYYVALAVWHERQAEQQDLARRRVQYRHQDLLCMEPAEGQYDIVTASYLLHEMPMEVARQTICKAYALLKPGGVLAMVDINPESAALQALPAFVGSIMKATEPWLDEYCSMDVRAAMAEAGFQSIEFSASDPRHRAMLGRKGSG